MPHFKNSQNQLYWLDEGDDPEKWLPEDCILISEEETAAIRSSQTPPAPTKAELIQLEINKLEVSQLLPRVTREFMLLQFENIAAQQNTDPNSNVAYRKLKEFDNFITSLRSQLS